jgi:cellulose synthase/poly-beta-1,6-N-acetylglucosamine synthase-like glycosyltransferase
MTALFLVAAAILLQAYAGYPFSLLLLRFVLGNRSRHARGEALPVVSLVISAYNEEKVIRRKIENSLDLDYPKDRLEIHVVSDGSTDQTEAIVREFENRGVVLHALVGRRGKVAGLNDVIPGLRSDLIVMSDANSIYGRESLRHLVRHFADPRVGCVCGRLLYLNPRGIHSGRGERVYWTYEGAVKRLESSLGSLLGANGAIYAYRRELFRPVDPLMFCDDVIPVRIAIEGYLAIYDPEAPCTEEAAEEAVERHRRARHASFGLRSMLFLMAQSFRRGRLRILYQCLSHRILRWAGGPALLAVLFAAPFLPRPWNSAALAGQGAFYTIALLGFLASRLGRVLTPLYLPYYFLVINLAGLRGLVRFVRRTDTPYWEPRQ